MRGQTALRLITVILALGFSFPASAQSSLLQGGPWAPGHAPMYAGQGGSQAVVQDSGPAGGGGVGYGFSEGLYIARGTGTPPYVAQGTGPFGTNWCDYDAPIANPTGYHYFCLSANAQGGGLLTYGPGGTASPLPLQLNLNGVLYQFPFSTGGVVGPATSVVGDIAVWNNTAGTLLKDVAALQIFGVEPANCVLAGPASGGSAFPTCRALVATDIPTSSSLDSLCGTNNDFLIRLSGTWQCGRITGGANALNYGLSTGNTATANATALGIACGVSGSVYIPGGTYNIQTASLTGCAHIYGDGIGQTKLVAAGSPSIAVLYFNGNADVLVENLEVDNTLSAFGSIDGIRCTSNVHCVVRNVLAEGINGISCVTVTDCLIENSTIDSYGTYGVAAINGTNAKMQFNTISGPAVASVHGVNCQIETSCEISYNKSTGALSIDIVAVDVTNAFIHGNLSINSIHESINVTYASGPDTRILIQNNIGQFNASSLDYCISVNAAGGLINNGIITGNICDSPGKDGIVLVQGAQNWLVSNNTIISPNAQNLDTATAAAIVFQGLNTNNNLASNNFINDVAGHMKSVGVELNDGTGNPNANIFGPNYGSRGTGSLYVTVGSTSQWMDIADAWIVVSSQPTIVCGSGAIGAYSAQALRYKRLGGKTVQFFMQVQAAAGSCSGTVTLAGLPFTFSSSGAPTLVNRDGTTGGLMQCIASAGASTVQLLNASNSSPTVTDLFTCSGQVEIN